MILVHQHSISVETSFVNTLWKSRNSTSSIAYIQILGRKNLLRIPSVLLLQHLYAIQIARNIMVGSHDSHKHAQARCTELVLEATKHKLLFGSTLASSSSIRQKKNWAQICNLKQMKVLCFKGQILSSALVSLL